MISVFTTNDCVQCKYTKLELEKQGIAYTELNVEQHPIFAEQLQEQGFHSLPVVKTPDETWQGFKLDKIRALVAE